ncbi:MAG: proton-conducting transporter membrane subunit [Candidatus Omnitrophica bacterium]|nr:proton-conducting transporter membrane subunit [Candidatus Omnitrophota bacterium]
MDFRNMFIFDPLSKLIGVFIVLFTVLISIYSAKFIKHRKITYYIWVLLTALASFGVIFSDNLILITIFWGFLGLSLFKLINLYDDEKASAIAKKTFIIIGATDGFLLFGFLLYHFLTSSMSLSANKLIINNNLSFISFIFIAMACFAKAGCMPLHTWIPETAKNAPLPVVAYLPASLDKLLGIYLLVRIVKDSFFLDVTAKFTLIIIGAITVICAVMMALIQHDIKKLLGYHAISQVGYMVLGIGCATPLGIAAGLFHMINHAIYKCCLFLDAGNVENETGTSELHNLGGLARYMPITFITFMVAAFSISGVPPFNGFVSKWMIYQGLSDFMNSLSSYPLKIIVALSLLSALVGSGLTLASFLKVISSVFLGNARKHAKESSFALLLPVIILALLCIIFGVFAYSTILKFITQAIGSFNMVGLWQPVGATALIAISIVIGLIVFKFSSQKLRVSDTYTGGEELNPKEEAKIEDFYATISEIPFLKKIYSLAEAKVFDIYEELKRIIFVLSNVLKRLHNGILPTYLTWCLIGIMGLFFVFFR